MPRPDAYDLHPPIVINGKLAVPVRLGRRFVDALAGGAHGTCRTVKGMIAYDGADVNVVVNDSRGDWVALAV